MIEAMSSNMVSEDNGDVSPNESYSIGNNYNSSISVLEIIPWEEKSATNLNDNPFAARFSGKYL